MEAAAGVVVAFIILLVVYVALAIKIVQQYQKGLVERFGRYRKTVGPGIQHDRAVHRNDEEGRHA